MTKFTGARFSLGTNRTPPALLAEVTHTAMWLSTEPASEFTGASSRARF